MKTIILILCVAITKISIAQTEYGAIKGVLVDEYKEPLPFFDVTLLLKNKIVAKSQTDFDGNYRLTPILSGTYIIAINSIGYISKQIINVPVIANNTTHVYTVLNKDTNNSKKTDTTTYKVPQFFQKGIDKDTYRSIVRDSINSFPNNNRSAGRGCFEICTDIRDESHCGVPLAGLPSTDTTKLPKTTPPPPKNKRRVKLSNNRSNDINIESGHATPRSEPIIDGPIIDTTKLRKKTP
jgi:hypothetical protein